AEDGIRDFHVTGVQTCALPISQALRRMSSDTRTERMGSIGAQPVSQMTSAATMAPTEPSRSPSTCSMAPLILTCSESPRLRYQRSEERRVGKESRARWRWGEE